MAASDLFKQRTQSELLALVVSLMVLDWTVWMQTCDQFLTVGRRLFSVLRVCASFPPGGRGSGLVAGLDGWSGET